MNYTRKMFKDKSDHTYINSTIKLSKTLLPFDYFQESLQLDELLKLGGILKSVCDSPHVKFKIAGVVTTKVETLKWLYLCLHLQSLLCHFLTGHKPLLLQPGFYHILRTAEVKNICMVNKGSSISKKSLTLKHLINANNFFFKVSM